MGATMTVWASIGQVAVFFATLYGFAVLAARLGTALGTWLSVMEKHAAAKRSEAAHAASNEAEYRRRWQTAEARGDDLHAKLADALGASADADALRESKAALRRRLRGVLWQARAWKAEAVARGWERASVNADRSALKTLRREAKARRVAAKGGR